jgi:diguanylate cyclase (GGDEF)-like protein/PAS domain S-box-containing protein
LTLPLTGLGGTGGLSLGENRFQAIYDSINDGILLLEPGTGAILEGNRKVREWFGWGAGELPDLDLGRLGLGLWPYTRETALEWCGKAAAGTPQAFEWLCSAPGGGLLWLQLDLRLAVIGGQDRLVVTASDITQRKRAEAESAARLKRAEAQNAVSLALAGVGADYGAALRLIAHHLAVQVGDLCTLNLVGEDGLLYPAEVAQPYVGGDALLPDFRQLPPLFPGQLGAGQVVHSGQALRLVNRPLEELRPLFRPEFGDYLERFQLHSLLAVPMRIDGHILGTIALAMGGASRPYSVEDQAVIQNLADRAALTIRNARLYAENLDQAAALMKTNQELERRVAERTAELADANARLQQMALEDGLTGLANRRQFDHVLDTEVRRALRRSDWLSLIMGDVDYFKRFNDLNGHVAGDGCLQAIGEVMKEVFRRVEEAPARYGGEEFAVVLPGADPDTARQAAEKFLRAVEARKIPHGASEVGPYVTVSLGTVSARVTAGTTPGWFITWADEGLYRSKAAGRNRVTSAG